MFAQDILRIRHEMRIRMIRVEDGMQMVAGLADWLTGIGRASDFGQEVTVVECLVGGGLSHPDDIPRTRRSVPRILSRTYQLLIRCRIAAIAVSTRRLLHGRGPNARGTEMSMKTIVIGILPHEQIRARALAIARGDRKPKPGEPRIWFTSMRSLAEVLSDENRALLRVIREMGPASISSLAAATGRRPGNLSRTLRTMSSYGIVDLKREGNQVRPIVRATEFRILAN
jgi:predicted transcriptional regulator